MVHFDKTGTCPESTLPQHVVYLSQVIFTVQNCVIKHWINGQTNLANLAFALWWEVTESSMESVVRRNLSLPKVHFGHFSKWSASQVLLSLSLFFHSKDERRRIASKNDNCLLPFLKWTFSSWNENSVHSLHYDSQFTFWKFRRLQLVTYMNWAQTTNPLDNISSEIWLKNRTQLSYCSLVRQGPV